MEMAMAPETPHDRPGNIVLAAEGLVKRYAGAAARALDGVSLQVPEGCIFGLLGPNGAGKTTAVSILSTLMTPTAGRLFVLGEPVGGSRSRLRRHIGLAPQEIALYGAFSARENLSYFGRMYGLRAGALEARMVAVLEAVGLSAVADRRVAVYSGGMQRRANLAVALVHAPRLLFLDEPTVGVDAQSRSLIMELLADLKHSGTTMVYTTHYMEEAEALCDTVAIMDAGRIIAEGPPADLLARHPGADSLGALFLELTGKSLRD